MTNNARMGLDFSDAEAREVDALAPSLPPLGPPIPIGRDVRRLAGFVVVTAALMLAGWWAGRPVRPVGVLRAETANNITAAADLSDLASVHTANRTSMGVTDTTVNYASGAPSGVVDLPVDSCFVRLHDPPPRIIGFGPMPEGTRKTIRFAKATTLVKSDRLQTVAGSSIGLAARDTIVAYSIGHGVWYVASVVLGAP